MPYKFRLSGSFFEALSARSRTGQIELKDSTATIFLDDKIVCSEIGIESIQNKKNIYLDNGFMFALAEPLTYEQERLLSHRFERGVSWFEKFTISKAMMLVVIFIFSLWFLKNTLTFIIPIATHIFPVSWEQSIGKNTYAAIKMTSLEPSQLSSFRIKRLKKKASQIAQANEFESPEILFHKSDLIGANALAFPGGPVVVTDDLVHLLQDDELILSVIAHEFAHVQQRHSLQQIIEVVGIAAISSIILGSNDTIIEEASAVGINLWSSRKSREFEREADLLALKYMEEANFDKSAFLNAIEKLTIAFCKSATESIDDCVSNKTSGWLSTHPSGSERIEYLSHLH